MAEGYDPALGRMRASATGGQAPRFGADLQEDQAASRAPAPARPVEQSDLPQHRFANWSIIRKTVRTEFAEREGEEMQRREREGRQHGRQWRDEMEDSAAFHDFVAHVLNENPFLGVQTQDYKEVIGHLYNEFYWYGALTPFLKDPDVEDIILDNFHWMDVVRGGERQVIRPTPFSSDEEVFEWLQTVIFEPRGKHFNRSYPLQSAILRDGSRLYAFTEPVSPFTGFALRRHKKTFKGKEGVEAYRREGGVAPDALFARMYEWVQADRNIVVSGATGSGKTTLLNWLASQVPPHQRIITLEDTPELAIAHSRVKPLWTSTAEARAVTSGEATGIDMSQLLAACLRLAPKRIVVGEVRGAEALDMLEAMNTGHSGSFTTLHANSPADAIVRLQSMAMKGEHRLDLDFVRLMIASAVEIVVQIVNLPGRGRRIVGVEQVLARHHYDALKHTTPQELKEAGIYEIHDGVFLRPLWVYDDAQDMLVERAEYWKPDHEVSNLPAPQNPSYQAELARQGQAPAE